MEENLLKVEKMEIVEKKLGKKQVAYITYKGPFDEIPVLMGEVCGLRNG
jgi:hypothetical protein